MANPTKKHPKKIKKIKKTPYHIPALLFAAIFAGIGVYVLTVTHAAPVGTLNLAPATSTVPVGTNVTVTVMVNSGTDPVDTVEADLKYEPSMLQFVNVDTSASGLDWPLEDRLNPNDNSVVWVTHGDKTPGSGTQTLASVTFTTLKAGKTDITFNPGSKIFLANLPQNQSQEILDMGNSHGSTITIAPTAPTGLSASGTTATGTTLSWSGVAGATRYDVYRGTTNIGSTSSTSMNVTGLTPGTAYQFKVQAFAAADNSSPQSTALSITTLADTEPPGAPTNFQTGAITGTSVALSWTASTDNTGNIARYDVYQGTTKIGNTTSTNYTVNTGLAPGTTYTFKVQAFDAAGNASPQATVTAKTVDDTSPPTAPGNLTVVPPGASDPIATKYVNLSWTAATDNTGITRYDIYQGATKIGTTTGTTYKVTGLDPLTTYTFKVVAFDAAGNSTSSANKVATTDVKQGDIDRNDNVDGTDFSLLALNFRKTGASRAMGDLSGNGIIDSEDLSFLSKGWVKWHQ